MTAASEVASFCVGLNRVAALLQVYLPLLGLFCRVGDTFLLFVASWELGPIFSSVWPISPENI